MTRLSHGRRLAVAILVVAIGGGILYIGSQRSTSVVAPTPSAVPSAVAICDRARPAGDPVPPELQSARGSARRDPSRTCSGPCATASS